MKQVRHGRPRKALMLMGDLNSVRYATQMHRQPNALFPKISILCSNEYMKFGTHALDDYIDINAQKGV